MQSSPPRGSPTGDPIVWADAPKPNIVFVHFFPFRPRGRAVMAWLMTVVAWMLLPGCGSPQTGARTAHNDPIEWKEWKAKRLKSVGNPYGWASLSGLHWLPEGTSWVGANASNQIVLHPNSAPPCLGRFDRSGTRVEFTPHPQVQCTVDGVRPISTLLTSDNPGPASIIDTGGIRIALIQRGEFGERLGLRVRDPKAPSRTHFKGLEYFPYDPKWRFVARWIPHDRPQARRFADVTGGIEIMTSPGTVVFDVEGTEYKLDAVEDPEEKDLFILFRDRTAGKSTYGSGRFVHAPMPDASGHVVLDFNLSYTPPCAFTPYATCPIPSRQNQLPLRIEAGEKGYAAGHSE